MVDVISNSKLKELRKDKSITFIIYNCYKLLIFWIIILFTIIAFIYEVIARLTSRRLYLGINVIITVSAHASSSVKGAAVVRSLLYAVYI